MTRRGDAYYLFVHKAILLLLAADLFLMTLGAGWLPGNRSEITAPEALPAVPVRADLGGLFGNLSVLSEDNINLEQAYLLINGERAGDFSGGELVVRVYPGDVLAIDASAYHCAVYFYLGEYSAAIDGSYLRESVICYGDTADLGIAVFK